MTKRLLITGANGFVGSHLTEAALNRGYEVFAAVRKNSDLSLLQNTKATLVYPDYFNEANLIALLQQNNITHIAHVAGATKAKTEKDYYRVNTQISVNLARAALQSKINLAKFVFVSSLAVMGPSFSNEIITENSTPHPITFYGISKAKAEQELDAIADLPLITVRPTAVYGPGEKDLLMLIKLINKHWELYIGRAPQQLSFIYVEDLCDAILLALDSNKNHEAYLLSDSINYDRYAFAEIAKNILHKRTIRIHIPAGLIKTGVVGMEKLFPRRNSILNKNKLQELTSGWPVSIDKAEKDLDFVPQFDLEKGLKKTIEWLKKEQWI